MLLTHAARICQLAFEGWNMVERRIMLIKWWLNNIWAHLSVFIGYSDTSARIWTRWIKLTFMWPCIVTNFFVIKPTRSTNFTYLFCHETLHVSGSSSVPQQVFIHCTFSNGTSHRFVDSFRAGPSCNHCCSEKSVINTYSECVFIALGIQHAMRMRHIVICSLRVSTIFYTLPHKRHDCRKKKLLNTKCVFWFSLLLSETFLILKIIQRDIIKNVYWSSRKVPVLLLRF